MTNIPTTTHTEVIYGIEQIQHQIFRGYIFIPNSIYVSSEIREILEIIVVIY